MVGSESVSTHAHHAIPKSQTVISDKHFGTHYIMRFVCQGDPSILICRFPIIVINIDI